MSARTALALAFTPVLLSSRWEGRSRTTLIVIDDEVEELQHTVHIAVHLLREEIQLGLAHLVDRLCDTTPQTHTGDSLLVLNTSL